ncbi:hypothetical protein J3A83DRAFT_4189683 [Scleroderma citrinum]
MVDIKPSGTSVFHPFEGILFIQSAFLWMKIKPQPLNNLLVSWNRSVRSSTQQVTQAVGTTARITLDEECWTLSDQELKQLRYLGMASILLNTALLLWAIVDSNKAIYHGSRAVLLVMVLGFVVEVGVMIFAMSRGTIASEDCVPQGYSQNYGSFIICMVVTTILPTEWVPIAKDFLAAAGVIAGGHLILNIRRTASSLYYMMQMAFAY